MILVARCSPAKNAIPIAVLVTALPLPQTCARAPRAFNPEVELVVVAAQCEICLGAQAQPAIDREFD
jgi:hypothetical protein